MASSSMSSLDVGSTSTDLDFVRNFLVSLGTNGAEALTRFDNGLKKLLASSSSSSPSPPTLVQDATTPIATPPKTWCSILNISTSYPRGTFTLDINHESILFRNKLGVVLYTYSLKDLTSVVELVDEKLGTKFLLVSGSEKWFLVTSKIAKKGGVKLSKGLDLENAPQRVSAICSLSDEQLQAEDVTSKLLRAALSLPENEPQTSWFTSTRKASNLNCYLKSVNPGTLFPLPQGLLFAASPFTFIPLEKIDKMEVAPAARGMAQMYVWQKGVVTPHELSQIDITEAPLLKQYIARAHQHIKTAQQANKPSTTVSKTSEPIVKKEENASSSSDDDSDSSSDSSTTSTSSDNSGYDSDTSEDDSDFDSDSTSSDSSEEEDEESESKEATSKPETPGEVKDEDKSSIVSASEEKEQKSGSSSSSSEDSSSSGSSEEGSSSSSYTSDESDEENDVEFFDEPELPEELRRDELPAGTKRRRVGDVVTETTSVKKEEENRDI